MAMPPNQFWYCALITLFAFTGSMCSTMFIISMTFERLYSIVVPHKAASFNTVKRAKITIVFIVLICFLWSLPQLFFSDNIDKNCIPYAKATSLLGQIYYWSYTVFFFPAPFLLLLTMNSIIIHILRKRSESIVKLSERQGQGQSEGKISKMKSSNRQMFTMLLLVAFAFLILAIPMNIIGYIRLSRDFTKTPEDIALSYLLNSIGEKLYYTNFGINFYLYVISGRKFRSDLVKLFKDTTKFCGGTAELSDNVSVTANTAVTSMDA